MHPDLRVLVLSPDFPPGHGGIGALVQQLATALEQVRVKVLTLDAPGAHDFDAGLGVEVARVRARRPGPRRAAIAALNLQAVLHAARFRPDVVLSGHIVCAPAASLLRRALGIPYVQYLHSAEVADRPGLARFALARAAAGIAVSKHTEELSRGVAGRSAAPLHRIPPGIHLPAEVGCPRARRPVVLTVSRMAERYKGHDVMIRALPLVRARVPEATWVVVGDGPLRPTWEGLAGALGQDAAVRFVGDIDDRERDRWLDLASVFVLLSRPAANGGGEGFGIVFLEAAAHRLPVVGVRAAGVLDAVVDGVTGLLVDAMDHVGVAEAISSLLRNPALAEAMGSAGAMRARDYGWPRIAERVREVLARAARPSSRAFT
jgi:phosphatidylinositol alpha-1,6-mannosyltransferase